MNHFVHIVGCPRSGTYLTVVNLSSQFDVAIPVETHFIPLFHRYKSLWGNLESYENRLRLLDAIYEFLEIWTLKASRDRDPQTVREMSLLITRPDRESIAGRSFSYGAIVRQLFAAYAGKMGMSLMGDKSAFFHHISLSTLHGTLPASKFIHVIRDGRDVCLSWQKIWTGPDSLAQGALAWKEHVEKKKRWGRLHPDFYFEFRYEDFIEHPDNVLQDIAAFLGVPADTIELDFFKSHMARKITSKESHPLLSSAFVRENKEKWRSSMSEAECSLFEFIAGKTLRDCGYDHVCPPPGLFRAFHLKSKVLFYRTHALFSVNFWGRFVKNHLPLALFFSSRFGFSLARLGGHWRKFRSNRCNKASLHP